MSVARAASLRHSQPTVPYTKHTLFCKTRCSRPGRVWALTADCVASRAHDIVESNNADRYSVTAYMRILSASTEARNEHNHDAPCLSRIPVPPIWDPWASLFLRDAQLTNGSGDGNARPAPNTSLSTMSAGRPPGILKSPAGIVVSDVAAFVPNVSLAKEAADCFERLQCKSLFTTSRRGAD